MNNKFGTKVKPTKDLFPYVLSTNKEYCIVGISDNYICLIDWKNRGNYDEFLRVRFDDLAKDFIFLDTDSSDIPGNALFGEKIVFKNDNNVLKNIELCVVGICENAIAVIEWDKRGEYHFDCYTLSDISDFEIIKDGM